MSHDHIPDDILVNILARLPGKPLLRFRCVSIHWNRLISDTCFMKLRSRKMVFLKLMFRTFPWSLAVLDYYNVPVDDKAHFLVRIRSPSKHQEGVQVSIVGTFNGIVLLAFIFKPSCRTHMILYNPLTCASKLILEMDPPSSFYLVPHVFVFGFGYGATPNDLKIVRFGIFDIPNRKRHTCDVFDLKTSSWSRSHYLTRNFYFSHDVGTFLNGNLYWVISLFSYSILALNIKDMVFTNIELPLGFKYPITPLSSFNGCLCAINKIDTSRFDVWMMKEQGVADSWLKTCTFTVGLDPDGFNKFHPIYILGDGKILIIDSSYQIAMYDTLKGSYERLTALEGLSNLSSIVYVESLVSPSDICFI